MTENKREIINSYMDTCEQIKSERINIVNLIVRDIEIFRVRLFLQFSLVFFATFVCWHYIYDYYLTLVLSSIETVESGVGSISSLADSETKLKKVTEWILINNGSAAQNPIIYELLMKILVVCSLSILLVAYLFFNEKKFIRKLDGLFPNQEDSWDSLYSDSRFCHLLGCELNANLSKRSKKYFSAFGLYALVFLGISSINVVIINWFATVKPTAFKFSTIEYFVNAFIPFCLVYFILSSAKEIYDVRRSIKDAFKNDTYTSTDTYLSELNKLSDNEILAMDMEKVIFEDDNALTQLKDLMPYSSDYVSHNDLLMIAFHKVNTENKCRLCAEQQHKKLIAE